MSAVKNNKGVPGVPLGALDAIQDENARLVLRAIVDGWHVRNGASGTGDAAFITRSEVPALAQTVIRNYIGAGSGGSGGMSNGGVPLPGEIDKIIGNLQASIFESQLWKDLGTRINTIDLNLVAEQQARVASVQQVADGLAEEAAARLGFDEVAGSKIATLETVTDTQAQQISGLITRVDGAESSIIDLRNTTSTQATLLSALTTRVGDTESNITTLFTTTANQAQSLTSLTTRVGTAESNISTLNTTTANQASTLVSLTTAINNAQAAISSEATTRANADNAITNSVNTQFTTVNSSISAIQSTQTTLSNSVASLSSTTTTLQSTVGDLSSSLSTEATTRATADGTLFSQYTVKVDVNGYVSGYGLASTAVNGVPTSDFIVRANRFAIGSPNGPGITPKVPFIVLTSTDVNGTPPGVYIDSAVIRNAAIDTAKIRDAAVDTLQIRGNAIFVPTTYSFPDVFVPRENDYLNELTVLDFHDDTAPIGGGFAVNLVCYADNVHTVDSYGILRLVVNGTERCAQQFGVRVSGGDVKFILPVVLSAVATSVGPNRIQAYVYCWSWKQDGSAANTFYLRNIRVTISAHKR